MSTTTLTPPVVVSPTLRSTRSIWWAFAVVIAASVMDLLDSTITQTAGPAIRRELGGSFADLEWFTAVYTLAMSATLLVGGRLGDAFGRRRMLLIGMTGFIVSSLTCAVAPTAGWLIGFRAVQGTFGAVMVVQGFGIVREMFGDEGQQKAFAVFGPVMGLAAVLGPLIGGGLVDLNLFGSGWRAIFLVNLPLGGLALAGGWALLPRVRPAHPQLRLDPVSVLLAMASGVGLVYPLIEGRQHGWPAWAFLMLAAGGVLLAAFAVRQAQRVRRGRPAMVQPSILRRRPYVAGLAVVLGFIGAMGGMMLALNVMFQAGLGDSPLRSGLATVAVPLAAIGGSITSSMLLGRIGRTTMHIGIAGMAIGLVIVDLVLRSAGAGLSPWDTAAPLALTGFGMGMVFVPMFDVILAGVAPHEIGSASGLLESVQQLAMSLGIALVGTVLFGDLGGARPAEAFVGSASHALLVAVGLLGLAWTAVWWLPQHARAGH
ncbi:MAG TPA: MFS transporter [Solirubrobacteraceae bacterium]|jgi:EmrB/QacA subfamily drug resistance transporter|nr:MFS transporter [Solirubrobacteraceae bacterium]